MPGLWPSPGSASRTHVSPPSNLPWRKRITHWYVHILVLNIDLPCSLRWWQLPRSPRLSSLSFPLMLSTCRETWGLFSPEAIFLLRREEWGAWRGGRWEKDPPKMSLWSWDPAAWLRNTQVSYLPSRPTWSQSCPSWWPGEGGSR